MAKKPKISPAQKESARLAIAGGMSYKNAARLVGITEHQVISSIRQVPDDVFEDMVKTTSRALLLRSYLKAMKAIDSITDEELKGASPIQKATIASIMIDKAVDKLAPTSAISTDGDNTISLDDVQSLVSSIQGKVAKLKVAGVSMEVGMSRDPQPLEVAPKPLHPDPSPPENSHDPPLLEPSDPPRD